MAVLHIAPCIGDQLSTLWMWLKITKELQTLVQKMMDAIVRDITSINRTRTLCKVVFC